MGTFCLKNINFYSRKAGVKYILFKVLETKDLGNPSKTYTESSAFCDISFSLLFMKMTFMSLFLLYRN